MPGEIFNGFVTLNGGMNALRDASLLPDTVYVKGVNVSVRGGLVGTRPALIQESVDLPQGGFQGAGKWSLESGDSLVFVVGGTVCIFDVDSSTLSTTVPRTMHVSNQCFFTQVERWLVVQDGASQPMVLQNVDGVISEFTGPAVEWPADPLSTDPPTMTGTPNIPVGYFGVYAHGRYHVVPKTVRCDVFSTEEEGRASVQSGDLMFPMYPTNVLNFTETTYLNDGGAHFMPMEHGFIGGIGVLRNYQTGTGLGAVIVFARNGVAAFDFSLDRTDQWKSQQLSQVMFSNAGCVSPWSVVNVNNDLLYRGTDGLRALRYDVARLAGGSGSLSNTPMSLEIKPYTDADSLFLKYVSASLFDNRVLMTTVPNGTWFRALACWDVAGSLFNDTQAPGVWDSIWTGDVFAQTVSALRHGVQTGYVFAEGPVLYRVDPDQYLDNGTKSIESRVETKVYIFDDFVTRKRLKFVEMWVSGLSRDTEIKVHYRPVKYPRWAPLGSRTIRVPSGGLPQYRRKIRFPLDFSDVPCDNTTHEPLSTACEFQFAIQWTGPMVVERFRASVEPLTEEPPYPCDEDGVGEVISTEGTVELNDFGYSIRG